jgi:hypothetical protein
MQNILGTNGAISRPDALGRRTDGARFQALRARLLSLESLPPSSRHSMEDEAASRLRRTGWDKFVPTKFTVRL